MKKLYTPIDNLSWIKRFRFLIMVALFISTVFRSYGQVLVNFNPRSSTATPLETIYNIKGDFTMLGNTNLTLVNYSNTANNNSDMRYVDVDTDTSTWNSSSANLTFSTENGAIPECSNIIYAGLYWTGRAGANETFSVTKGSTTKIFDKKKVLIKGPSSSAYQEVTALNNAIFYPSNTYGDMYSAYAEITDYVKLNGVGSYTVADIALIEGNGGNTGFYGGWGMVVVYENSKMNWRDVTVFDGHAYVASNGGDKLLPISGFRAAQNGPIDLKIGVMAGEGDVGVPGDRFEMLRQDTNAYESLSHSGNTVGNFFNSSIVTGNARNPNLQNNTGIDIAMFNIDNGNNNAITTDDNKFVTNNQNSTSFRYGSTQDTYIIFNITFSVNAYIPEPVGVLTTTSVTNPNPQPGEAVDYNVEIRNKGTEAINNTVITIPIPEYIDPSILSINFSTNYTTSGGYSDPFYDPSAGPFGSIIWNLGTLPLPIDPNQLLAEIGFSLTITKDCTGLNGGPIDKDIILYGGISGVGATSNQSFTSPFIQGYETNGLCIGEPIPVPIVVAINYQDYINEPPTASNPAPINVQCKADVPVPEILVVTDEADNSGTPPIVAFVSDVSDNGINPEIITRTYSVTDDCDNSINVQQTITINDNIKPVITGTISTTTVEGCSTTDATPAVTSVAALEALGLSISDCTSDENLVVTSSDVSLGTCPIVVTRTYTITDTSNNFETITQTININDTTQPLITGSLPTESVQGCSITDVAPAVTTVAGLETLGLAIADNCTTDANLVVTSSDSASGTCPIIVTRTYTITDACNNASQVIHTITVQDTTAPAITGTIATTTIEGCAATDVPVAVTTVAALETLGLAIADNCTIDANLVVTSSDSSSGTCPIIVTRTYTITDACNNASQAIQTINVNDSTAPAITGTITTSTIEGCAATDVPVAVTTVAGLETLGLAIADNCTIDANLVVTSSDSSSGTCPIIVTRTYTITDACNNASQVIQTINVNDSTAPAITGTITTSTIEGCAATDVPVAVTTVAGLETLGLAIADNCTIDANLVVTSSDSSSGTCPIIVTRTYTITDACNNASQVIQTINVNDSTAPAITGTITTSTIEGCAATDVPVAVTTVTGLETLGLAIADNCTIDANLVVTSSDSASGTCPIIVTRTYTITDACNNASQVIQTITVQDTTAPVINTTVGSLDVTLECSNTAGITAALALAPTATDNCNASPNVILVSDVTTADATCANGYVRVRTWNFTDGCNNTSANFVQTITVQDTTAPIIDTTAGSLDATLECSNTAGITAALALAPTATDNCNTSPNLNLVSDVTTADATCANAYIRVRTWNFTDGCNNTSANFVQTISVEDTTPPIIDTTNKNNIEIECGVGDTQATLAAWLSNNAGATATDNCGRVTWSNNYGSDDTVKCDNGAITVTFTATDVCGNINTTTATYLVKDNIAPVVSTTAGSLDATLECSDSAGITTALALAPTATDDCSAAAIALVSDVTTADATCANAYVRVRTWNFTDGCNNTSANFVQTITVQDTTAPIIDTTAGSLDATLECSDTAGITAALALAPTATDNCNTSPNLILVSDVTTADATCANAYVRVRTWNFTDGCNNTSANFVQTITVQDTTAPVINTTAGSLDATLECSNTAGIAVALALSPTATDNCNASPNVILVSDVTTADATCANGYVRVRTWNFTDGCNNTSANFVQTITVQDTTAPIIDTTAGSLDATLECSNTAGITAALALAPTATDNCNTSPNLNLVSDVTTADATCANAYIRVRTWNFTDGCNNTSANFVQTISVEDTTPPIIDTTNKNNIEIECGVGDTQATLAAWLSNNAGATATDNCGRVTWSNNYGSDDTVKCDNGAITVTFTATDVCGNINTTTATYLVKDNIAPVVSTTAGSLDATLECSDSAGITTALALAPTATDDCSAAAIALVSDVTTADATCANAYVRVRTWNFTDGCNNTSANFVQTITVQDTTAPIIDTTAGSLDATLECSDTAGITAALALAPTATDNCNTSPNLILVSDVTTADATCANAYVRVRTWNFTDGCNNTSANFVQTITVQDTTAPVLTVPTDVTVECSEDFSPNATGSATAIDNCDVTPLITFSDVTTPGSCPSESIITRTWNATDNCNNTTSNIQTITIKDTTAPSITTSASNIVVQCDGLGNTTAINDWLNNNGGAIATDNCGIVTWSNSYNGAVSDCSTPIDVVFTAIDECGNISSTIASYSIEDTIAPSIDTPAANLTVECDGAGNLSELTGWITTFGGAIASDDCSAITWSNNFTTLSDDCGETGSATVTFTATDGCGNSSTTSATFTIIDTTAPTAPNALADITYECIDDVPNAGNLIANDNCSGEITVTGTDTTDNTNPCNIIITRTWTFTDACNNTSSVSQTITVKDTTAPVLTLPANVSAECSDDLTPIAFGSATATDNCDTNPVITYNDVRTDGDCSGTFTITRTWTATDACGNVSTADQIISTSDTTAPEFVETILPQDITIECNAIPAAESLTATDNCGTATVTVNDIRTNGSCDNNYIISRTWTATDDCGLTKTHIQKITVQDTTPPVFVETLPPTNLVVECDAVPTAQTLTATDICGSATVTVNDVRTNGSCPNNYTLARTWTVTDECGLKTTHTQIIVVRDTKAPKFVGTLPSNITVECDAVPNALTLTATDNCGSATVTVNDAITIGNCPSNYIIARTYTATDECGLKTTHTQLIIVQDTKAPTVVTTFDAVLNVSCTNIPEVPDLKFQDNCSSNINVVYSETNTFADNVYLDYEIVRTWTVTDECNNEAKFTQTLNVALDEIISSIVAQDRCFDDGIVNLNDLISSDLNKNGTWELLEGDPTAILTGSIFNPTVLELSRDFLPEDGGIDYIFRYTTTDNGCISITEMTMNIHADCVVLPCGENDVTISKAVTPNGDAYNEFFEISGIELCGFRYDVKIFNRWGALIYESDNYQNNWNGTVSKSSIGTAGKIPNGTYYYIVTLKDSGLRPFTGPLYISTK